jgi:hypothetical protein
MDITIKVVTKQGERKSHTFIGEKEDILLDMQEYIKKNSEHYIDIFFSTEEESKQLTYDELFNP